MSTCKKCNSLLEDGWICCPICGKKVAGEKKKKSRRRANGEGTVYARGNTYTARVIFGYEATEDGRLRVIKRDVGGFATMRAAYAALPSIREMGPPNASSAAPVRQTYEHITFSALYDRFVEEHEKKVVKQTMACYKAARAYYKDIEHIPFAELNTEDWQMCLDDCPRGIRTKQNMKALGTLMYKEAAKLRVFGLSTTTDFASLAWLPAVETESREPFTAEELKIIKDGAAKGILWSKWIEAMCYLGFRPTEFLTLGKQSFDVKNWTLCGGAKTEAGKNRIVPIHESIRPFIMERFLKCENFLFEGADGQQIPLDHFRREMFYPTLEVLGIQKAPKKNKDGKSEKTARTPYSTRHTFATLMKAVPGATKDKAALMGHTSYEMTLHYQHEDYQSLRGIIDAIA